MATKHFLGGRVIHGTEFVGYKYKFFEPGTSTPKTTYKDSALTVGNENAHPVVLDANGAAQIWFDGNADVIFYTSADVVVYSDDDINVSTTESTSGSGNLITNGSFETDSDADGIPDNWTRTLYTAGTFSLQTTDQFNGQKSVKFTSTGTGGGYITSTDQFAVSPSVIYTIGWAMKGTADVRNVVEVLWYQDDGSASAVTASTTVYDDSTTNPTSWTEKWYETGSPSDAAFAKIRLTGCHSSDATAGSTTYDSVIFTDLVHKRSPNTMTLVDATATVGPLFTLDRNSSSPAASDVLGGFVFTGRNSGTSTKTYAQMQAEAVGVTTAAESGRLALLNMIAGTLGTRAYLGTGFYMGTHSDKGNNTINGFIYDSGIRISEVLIESRAITTSTSETFSNLTPGVPYRFDINVHMSGANRANLMFNSDSGNNYADTRYTIGTSGTIAVSYNTNTSLLLVGGSPGGAHSEKIEMNVESDKNDATHIWGFVRGIHNSNFTDSNAAFNYNGTGTMSTATIYSGTSLMAGTIRLKKLVE